MLFVYNRPYHTRKILEALRENVLADQSTLVIYADGPKPHASGGELAQIHDVRHVLKQEQWCREVIIHEADGNSGLADSIIRGVTETINTYGKVIVLEDDIVTSPGFLDYMNNALDLYEEEEQVMHVSGYMFPVNTKLPETFFYNTASCWGWGTWQRAWQHFNPDAAQLAEEIEREGLIDEFNLENNYPFFTQLGQNIDGTLKTWAVKWYASFFLQRGYALHPYPSLTNNIGNDGSGVNSGTNNRFGWNRLATDIEVKKIPIEASAQARQAMHRFYKNSYTKSKAMPQLSMIRIPKQLKHLTKRVVDKDYRLAYQEKKRLRRLPRYTKTSTLLLDRTILIPDAASYLFMYEEIFERHIYRFNTRKKKPYLLDCGANIGLSIIYFKQLFPEAEVVGFEPDSNIYSILQNNVQAFSLENVQLIDKAVWKEETTLQFAAEGADGGRIETADPKETVSSVRTVRLRDYLESPVDFLKIDIEGAESVVVKDCADLLSNVAFLFIEYHSFTGQPQTLDEILKTVKSAGFRYYVSSPGLTSLNPFVHISESAGMDMQLNIHCMRE